MWKNIQKKHVTKVWTSNPEGGGVPVVPGSLFDIVHQDVLQIMNIQEDKVFLTAQRHGRQGCCGWEDKEEGEEAEEEGNNSGKSPKRPSRET